jgi:hypothetical protein
MHTFDKSQFHFYDYISEKSVVNEVCFYHLTTSIFGVPLP